MKKVPTEQEDYPLTRQERFSLIVECLQGSSMKEGCQCGGRRREEGHLSEGRLQIRGLQSQRTPHILVGLMMSLHVGHNHFAGNRRREGQRPL